MSLWIGRSKVKINSHDPIWNNKHPIRFNTWVLHHDWLKSGVEQTIFKQLKFNCWTHHRSSIQFSLQSFTSISGGQWLGTSRLSVSKWISWSKIQPLFSTAWNSLSWASIFFDSEFFWTTLKYIYANRLIIRQYFTLKFSLITYQHLLTNVLQKELYILCQFEAALITRIVSLTFRQYILGHW